jgi:hypothetical protein
MPRDERTDRQVPRRAFGTVTVPGTRVGAVVALGVVALAWATIPLARPFLLGTVALGCILGAVLWWKHSH